MHASSRSLFVAFSFVALISAAAACHRGGSYPEQSWTAAQITSPEVRITPGEISVSRDRLYVKTTLVNTSDKPLTVERDGIQLKLPDGRTLRRSTGMTSTHKPYIVQPGATQNVWVDFLAEGFEWNQYQSATVDFSEAIHAGATPVAVPPLVLSARALAQQ